MSLGFDVSGLSSESEVKPMAWDLKMRQSQLLDRYTRYRKVVWKLNNEILPNYLSSAVFGMGGKALGILQRNKLILDNEDDIGVMMDYCIHECRERGSNAVQRYRAESRLDPGSDEYIVAKAMSESFYTLVRVEEVLRGVGVRVVDMFAGREYFLVDIGFGSSAVKGGVLATRLFSFDEFVTTSGAALPVNAEILRRIEKSVLTKYRIEEDGKCTLAGGRQKAADRAAAIIRLCFKGGASDRIRYVDFT
ncbi:MAG: hypothetical protein ABFE01_25605 [Phycisphaerales bacterium]